jgi:hypothetical protein
MRWLLTLLFLLGPTARFVAAQAQGPVTNLTADEVIARFIERTRGSTNRLALMQQSFVRRTVIEQLGGDGSLKERKVREHLVEVSGLEQRTRLLRLDNRAATETEARREGERDAENQKRYTARGDRVRRNSNADYLDEKLIRRFRYELITLEDFDGRPAYRLRFRPNDATPGKEIADRVLGRLGGELWIDSTEFELVKVDAKLTRSFDVWGGVVATLERLDFAILRQRLADGTWVNVALNSEVAGRKVFAAFRSRFSVQQEDFRPLAPMTASP